MKHKVEIEFTVNQFAKNSYHIPEYNIYFSNNRTGKAEALVKMMVEQLVRMNNNKSK